MKKIRKIMVMLTAIMMMGAIISSTTNDAPSTVKAETDTVTGTFTPTGGVVSISTNRSTPQFGNIDLGSYAENLSINVTNNGTVTVDVTMTAGQGTGGWTLVAGTSSPATNDEYCINMNPNATGYVDVYSQQTVIADMVPTGQWNHTDFDLKVYVSQFTTEETPSSQTFYANLTASASS